MVILILVELLIILARTFAVSDQNIDFLYSPLHLKKHDMQKQQGASTKIKVAENANLIFVSGGGEGIVVIDSLTYEIIFKMASEEFLYTIEVTSDGEYVMISYQEKFSIFRFENTNKLILLSQAQFPTTIMDLFKNNKENTIFAVGTNGQLVAYNISNKYSVEQIGYFNSQSNIIHQGYISKDDQWIFLGNDILGLAVLRLSMNSQDNSIEFTLAGQGIMNQKTWACVVTDDLNYVYGIDNWYGMYISDFRLVKSASQDQYPVEIQFTSFWPFPRLDLIYSLKLTKDNKYLMIGLVSVGILILDIQDRFNPSPFQIIPVPGQALSINLSSNEQYLYYANGISIYIFERRPVNLNNHFPNLFNQYQATMQDTSIALYRWRCFTRKIDQIEYYFGSYDTSGFYIFKSQDPFNFVQVFDQQFSASTLVDSMAISKDQKYLYVPVQEKGNVSFIVYNLENINKPQEVFKYDKDNFNFKEQIRFSLDYKYLLSSNDKGILLFDCSNPPAFELLASWYVLPAMIGENSGVMMTHDNKYIIGTVRSYGLYVLDASDKSNLIYKDSLQTLGAENIVSSIYSNDYAFLIDGFKGVVILDLTVLPEINILSRIPLVGWVNFVVLVQKDNYLLTVVMQEEMLSLIDITDKKNPKVMSKYKYQSQSAQSLCLSTDENYTYINNQLGTITLPLKNQVTIHTELQRITPKIDGSVLLESISKNVNLKVGEQIQLQFVFIYPKNGVKIISVSYYSQFQNNPLPFWMNYNQESQILLIKVDKSGLDSKNIKAASLNTVLLKVLNPLSPSSFIFNSDGVQTTSGEAEQIFQALQNINLIDSMGYVTELFDPQKSLFFELNGINFNNNFYKKTKLVIQQSININPVIFYIEPSLSINIRDLENPIKTLSLSLQLFLTVDVNHGKFVMGGFTGVIVSTNDSQNQIKLEGSLVNLNNILSKKLIFANSTEIEKIKVTITIIDGINYDLVQESQMSECLFINKKQHLTKNSQNSLQYQFNKQQPQGIVEISTYFSISFAKNSFVVSDVQTISFKAFILQNEEYKLVTADDWIQFQETSGQASISGIPPASAFKKIIYVKILASDGYTEDYDIFYINASGLPFFLVFDILIKVLGPFFAIFGLYKYKSYVLNMFLTKQITYSDETAIVGQLYLKQITLIGDQMEKSQLLFKEFIRLIYYRQDNLNAVGVDQFQYQEKEVNEVVIDNDESKIIQNGVHPLRRLKVSTNHPSVNDEYLKKSINIIKMSTKHTRKTFFENQYLKNDGNLNMRRIIRDIRYLNVSFQLRGKTFYASSMLSDFKNPDSLIFNGIKALAARYFLKFDLRSSQVYNYIKYYAQKYHTNTKNDWYKSIISISPSDKASNLNLQTPFSQFSLNQQQLNLILMDLQVHNQIGQSFDSLKDLGINHHLIKEVLIADAKGLQESIPSIFFPSQGESIHLFQYDIQSVEAFKKVENTWFTKMRRALNLEYIGYGIYKGQNLPSWLKLEYKQGALTLSGIPNSQDEEKILIRIIDQDLYVVQQFMLNIVNEYGGQDEENFLSQNNDNSINEDLYSSKNTGVAKHIGVSIFNNYNQKNKSFDHGVQILTNLDQTERFCLNNNQTARDNLEQQKEQIHDESSTKYHLNDQLSIRESVQYNLNDIVKEEPVKDLTISENPKNVSFSQIDVQ